MELSIVIPVFNEEGNVEELAQEVDWALEGSRLTWECLWVDDGSTDGTADKLYIIAARDPKGRHRFLRFERNAGQSAALWAGFRHARGALIATLDGDGQNDPADLPRLVDMLRREGYDMVNGYRAKRRDSLVRKISSRIANGFRNWVTGKTVRDVGCSTRVFRRECVEHLPPFKGLHRFLPTLTVLYGYRIAETQVGHRPRRKGVTKYGIHNRLWVGLLDSFGVWWLRRRAFRYRIVQTFPEEGCS
ncbi:dolichol-phosphate mannosyltransferase [Desulfacinum infernum DSM 9756]|uniref:Dolichol-phosphate mannosyltransferase n=1 Tax=Desulfacinum infernum DSM 9756 TaxID=1121391 RepID=A0A1M5I121_9BACT|nr:glycosyltransferase family 2 protein [Desulfacinum infernum]SHG21847.1 dolichol-phosphate mannosyltransferase [Desulfacinum infernum DSM 9756]